MQQHMRSAADAVRRMQTAAGGTPELLVGFFILPTTRDILAKTPLKNKENILLT